MTDVPNGPSLTSPQETNNYYVVWFACNIILLIFGKLCSCVVQGMVSWDNKKWKEMGHVSRKSSRSSDKNDQKILRENIVRTVAMFSKCDVLERRYCFQRHRNILAFDETPEDSTGPSRHNEKKMLTSRRRKTKGNIHWQCHDRLIRGQITTENCPALRKETRFLRWGMRALPRSRKSRIRP
jgi:hypothetical protein